MEKTKGQFFKVLKNIPSVKTCKEKFHKKINNNNLRVEASEKNLRIKKNFKRKTFFSLCCNPHFDHMRLMHMTKCQHSGNNFSFSLVRRKMQLCIQQHRSKNTDKECESHNNTVQLVWFHTAVLQCSTGLLKGQWNVHIRRHLSTQFHSAERRTHSAAA